MKRIKFMLLAIAMLLAASSFLTSCQENAPEINYTMNVSVTNDFAKVVEAINNSSLKNEAAIKKLTEAIDKMNADQQTKMQAIVDMLNSVNATLDTKLALLESAIKAQTLSMEGKMALLEAAIKALPDYTSQLEAIKTAIKALPDYTSQLEAIKTTIKALPDYGKKLDAIQQAIKAMPNYNDKFDAVVAALKTMKTQIETLGTEQAGIAKQIAQMITAIEKLSEQVKKGDADNADALTKIIAKLEELKAAIESGKPTVAVTGVKLDKVAFSLKEGDTKTLVATVKPAEATNKKVTWQSSDPSVAKVDADGKVTALKVGHTATITVTTVDGAKTATCTVKVIAEGTPSTEDYVDLGLPSGTLWATKNLGALTPSDYGDYYAWGETEPKTEFTWDNYKWGVFNASDPNAGMKKYNQSDGKTRLEDADDAVIAKLGAPWRMPTEDDVRELIGNCTWKKTELDGVRGSEVKGPNGNTIFLPAAGFYGDRNELFELGDRSRFWTKDHDINQSSFGVFLECFMDPQFSGDKQRKIYESYRCYGITIRPVRK